MPLDDTPLIIDLLLVLLLVSPLIGVAVIHLVFPKLAEWLVALIDHRFALPLAIATVVIVLLLEIRP